MSVHVQMFHERRGSPRVELERPCKVFDPKSGRYIAGTTCNMSSHGALLLLEEPLFVEPGARLHIGIALKRRQALLFHNEMIQSEVVRILRATDGRTSLAVRFAEPIEAVLSAARLAA